MNLCHYIGRPLTAQIDISDDFPEVEQEWKVQVSDITARPEYGILNKQIAIAEQEGKAESLVSCYRVSASEVVMIIFTDWKSMMKL